ncbi:hypothetical protein B0H11DRAFT_1920027 [Mycena galericulata]|nr:hypothetical protein B0H11DRAFT_1920027 [Mycena galericulata]
MGREGKVICVAEIPDLVHLNYKPRIEKRHLLGTLVRGFENRRAGALLVSEEINFISNLTHSQEPIVVAPTGDLLQVVVELSNNLRLRQQASCRICDTAEQCLRFYEEKFRGKLFLQITGDGAVGLELGGWRTVLPTVETLANSRDCFANSRDTVAVAQGVERQGSWGMAGRGTWPAFAMLLGIGLKQALDARWRVRRVHVLRNNDEYNEARNGSQTPLKGVVNSCDLVGFQAKPARRS